MWAMSLRKPSTPNDCQYAMTSSTFFHVSGIGFSGAQAFGYSRIDFDGSVKSKP